MPAIEQQKPMTKDEVKDLGRSVGAIAGFLGYFTGATGAWFLHCVILYPESFQKGADVPVAGWEILVGGGAGILLTMLVATLVIWKTSYSPRPLRMSGVSVVGGAVQGLGAAITMLFVMLYALAVAAMWVLGAIVLLTAALL